MAENVQMAASFDVRRIAQDCLREYPLVILGSGSSVPFGLPTMSRLKQALCDAPIPKNPPQGFEEEWGVFSEKLKLSDSDNFEKTLAEFESSDDISSYAATVIRDNIVRADWSAMLGIARDNDLPPLSRLFKYMLDSTRREVQVVTTNYDRIAECAIEKAGYRYYAGFTHGHLRQLGKDDRKSSPSRQVNHGVVNVWKVHGSVDWFYHAGKPKRVIGLPISDGDPGEKWAPAIIFPGNLKCQHAHEEPFRTIIQKADAAIVNSKSILCIGFGFNDQHILPKLEECCQKPATFLVVLAEKLTDNTKDFFRQCRCRRRLALESASGGGKCRMFSFEYPDGVEIDEDLWRLSSFISLV